MEQDRFISAEAQTDEQRQEQSIRPDTLSDYIGQPVAGQVCLKKKI